MKKKNFKNSKFKKIILTIFGGIVILSFLFWHYLLKPSILWDETFWNKRLAFFQAISFYNEKFGRLPTSLEEMVTAGFLPEKSNLYSCPILHDTRDGKKLSYTECKYVITFDLNKIVIYVPKEVFNKWDYKSIDEDRRKWEFLKEWCNKK